MPCGLKKRSPVSPVSPTGVRWQRPFLVTLITSLVFAFVFFPRRFVVLNLSPSVPLGLYYEVDDEPEVGRLAEFRLPIEMRYRLIHGWEKIILKPIAAKPGDHVDTSGDWLWINSQRIAPIHTKDSKGHTLPVWRANRRLEQDEFFMYSARVSNSFDSRYYGPVRRSDIIAVREPLWTWGEEAEAGAGSCRGPSVVGNPGR